MLISTRDAGPAPTHIPENLYLSRAIRVLSGIHSIVQYSQCRLSNTSNGPLARARNRGADHGRGTMVADMAKELRPRNIAAVSIWMGGPDTERARAYLAKLPDDARPNAKRESPQVTGRVIAALYASDRRMPGCDRHRR
jgi:hypothetical protein